MNTENEKVAIERSDPAEPTVEQAELRAVLEERLRVLAVELPEKEREAQLERALELFATRCDIQDITSEKLEESVAEAANESVSGEVGESGSEVDPLWLKSEYNIDFPERYPPEVLEGMREESTKAGPWGIVIVAKADHNGAFERTPQLQELRNDLGGDVGIKIVEAGSAQEGADLMIRLAAKHGKALFGICMAHGSETGFTLSEEGEGRVSDDISEEAGGDVERPLEDQEERDPSGLAVFGDAFAQATESAATLVMVSCSTGKGSNSVGQRLARITKRKTVAPDADTFLERFGAAPGATVRFNAKYSGATTKEFEG